jgi:hypothetical protein
MGLAASTYVDQYGNGFRIDFGNWHDHFADWGKTGLFTFLDEAFELVDDIRSERLILVAKWLSQTGYYGELREPTYAPTDTDWEKGIAAIWVRSWHGTCDREWRPNLLVNGTSR